MTNIPMTFKLSEYRPCIVDGEKALFHRWIDKCMYIIEFKNIMIDPKKFIEIKKDFENTNIIPSGATVHKIVETRALVEFENGEVKEIEPLKIKFLDSPSLFEVIRNGR